MKKNAFYHRRPGLPAFAFALLLGAWLAPAAVHAHVPHDAVTELVLSPDFARDGSAFSVVRGNFFVSRDRGYTWRRGSRGIHCSDRISALARSERFATDGTLYLACHNGDVFRSQDRGRTWSNLALETSNDTVVQLVTSPREMSDAAILAVTAAGKVLRFDPLGRGAHEIGAELVGVTVVAWNADGSILAGNRDGELFASNVGSAAWRRLGAHPEGAAVSVIHRSERASDAVYVGTAAGLLTLSVNQTPQVQVSGALAGRHLTALASEVREGSLVLYATAWDEAIFRSNDGEIDQYSEKPHYLVDSFSTEGLASGPHRVRVVVSERTNDRSSGTSIALDAFEVFAADTETPLR